MTIAPRTDEGGSTPPSSPRFRFRLRHLLLLPLLAGLGFFVVESMYLKAWISQGSELVEIQVIDAQSREPIPGSSIQIANAGKTMTGVANSPDADIAFAVPYRFEGRSSLLRSKLTEDPWDMIVSAPGYATSRSRLGDHRLVPGDAGSFPSPIVISLTPEGDAR